ncbi:unnamed protein product [Pieris macdunnoughi]|uniref:Salivary secreted peptide n=1 Tax=Pieris macdunnoughi TaxID=345717 RepID=A0A821MKT3_9NEOP|nr:unnamed protein product [Pieris macdunnoughi]
MSSKLLILFCGLIVSVHCTSVVVGRTHDVHKVYEAEYEANSIPFFKRSQEVSIEYPVGDQKIKGIAIIDLQNGKAEPSITSGGIGFGFAKIKLKSERGSGYKFRLEVYA